MTDNKSDAEKTSLFFVINLVYVNYCDLIC